MSTVATKKVAPAMYAAHSDAISPFLSSGLGVCSSRPMVDSWVGSVGPASASSTKGSYSDPRESDGWLRENRAENMTTDRKRGMLSLASGENKFRPSSGIFTPHS